MSTVIESKLKKESFQAESEFNKKYLMHLPKQLAKHIREMHFGGNWTDSNLRDQVYGISWQEANTQISKLNTIAELVFHINYFVKGQLNALLVGKIDIHDKYSFDMPIISNKEDWSSLLEKCWKDAEDLANCVENLPQELMATSFIDERYGTYYENFQGLIEHTHYHLGQLVIVKKMIRLA